MAEANPLPSKKTKLAIAEELRLQKLVNTIQAAEILGLKPNTLEIWRCRNKGPRYKKLGRRILYDPSDLEDYARSCTVHTDPVTRFINNSTNGDRKI